MKKKKMFNGYVGAFTEPLKNSEFVKGATEAGGVKVIIKAFCPSVIEKVEFKKAVEKAEFELKVKAEAKRRHPEIDMEL